MTKKTLTWLHLSDLHSRTSTEWDSRQVIEKLISDLKDLQNKNNFYPDIVVFSGDAAFGNISEQRIEDQYKDVGKFIDSVRKSFKPELPLNCIYLVPGNHD